MTGSERRLFAATLERGSGFTERGNLVAAELEAREVRHIDLREALEPYRTKFWWRSTSVVSG